MRTILTTLAIVLGVGMVSAAFTLTDTMRGGAELADLRRLRRHRRRRHRAAPRSRSRPRATTRCRSRRSTPRCSSGSARSRRSAPPSATSPTRPRSSAATASRSATARTSASASTRARAGAEELTAVPPRRTGAGRPAPARSSSTPRRPSKQDYAVGDRVKIATRGAAAYYEVVGVAALRHGQVARHRDRRGVRPRDRAGAVRQGGPLRLDPGRRPLRHPAGRRPPGGRGRGRRTTPRSRRPRAHDRFTLDGLKMFIGIIKTVLLVFGVVAVLVGAFTIFNTLSITVAQRSREFGLLRMVGAARRQVLRLGADRGARHRRSARRSSASPPASASPRASTPMFGAMDIDLPDAGMVFAARTAIVALLVGHARHAGGRVRAGAAGDPRRPRGRAARRRSGRAQAPLAVPLRAGGGVAARPAGGSASAAPPAGSRAATRCAIPAARPSPPAR